MIMQIIAWIASVFVFCSFFMVTMIPLRIIAIVSNVIFITYSLLGLKYGIFEKIYPIFILHSLLLPLNIYRLIQMKNLLKKIDDVSHENLDAINVLVPFMKKKKMKKGDVLFEKGDKADKMYYIQSGHILLPEIDKTVHKGSVLGEVGIFTPNNSRAVSAISGEECEIYSITADKVLALYYQDPKIGFFFIRTIAKTVTDRENYKDGILINFKKYASEKKLDND